MDRRDFLANVSRTAVGTAALVSLSQLLAACASIPEISANTSGDMLDVPKSAFMDGDKLLPLVVARVSGKKFPVAIVAPQGEKPYALLMKCTHKSCPLQAEASGFECDCHGSTFDMHGAVTKGPAKEPLAVFPVQDAGDAYRVNLQGMM
jgi:Rieske Fe-S protein